MYEANKNFQLFFTLNFAHVSVSTVTSSIPAGVLYSIPQKMPLKWYFLLGLMVHGSHFRKIWHFPWVVNGWNKTTITFSFVDWHWCCNRAVFHWSSFGAHNSFFAKWRTYSLSRWYQHHNWQWWKEDAETDPDMVRYTNRARWNIDSFSQVHTKFFLHVSDFEANIKTFLNNFNKF